MEATASARRRRNRIIGLTLMASSGIALAIIGIVLGFSMLFPKEQYVDDPDDTPSERTFDGDSKELQHTVIVPTLDTPIPAGKSAIWCSSIQIAWNRLKNDVVKGPIQLENAEAVAERLNRAEQSADDLPGDSYYAAAGFAKDGIVSKIRKDMSERFPRVSLPEFNAPPDGAVMYGYLRGRVKFSHFYHDNPAPLTFTDSAGGASGVRAFGVPKDKQYDGKIMLEQIGKLFRERGTFALDLCTSSWPNQIVVARMDRKETLAATWEDLRSRYEKARTANEEKTIGSTSKVLVPNLNWRVLHHFQELEGPDKRILNPGTPSMYLGTGLQMLQFRLDRTGAAVESSFHGEWLNGHSDPPPDEFYFDRPFLIVMKKRGAKHPFFVMWVDNAELLSKY